MPKKGVYFDLKAMVFVWLIIIFIVVINLNLIFYPSIKDTSCSNRIMPNSVAKVDLVILMQFDVIEMEKVTLRKESCANQKKTKNYWHQLRHMKVYMRGRIETGDSEIFYLYFAPSPTFRFMFVKNCP